MGRLLDKIDKIINEERELSPKIEAEGIISLRLSEFSRKNMAIEIYSEVIGCNLWLCSDQEMKEQIMRDAPGQVCYTARELWRLVKLNPAQKDLKRIHDLKEVFPKSHIKNTNNTK